jgi:uncharacterized membrane protein
MQKILKLTYLNLNIREQFKSQILLHHCVLLIFVSSTTYYLLESEFPNISYEFYKIKHVAVKFWCCTKNCPEKFIGWKISLQESRREFNYKLNARRIIENRSLNWEIWNIQVFLCGWASTISVHQLSTGGRMFSYLGQTRTIGFGSNRLWMNC